MSNNLYPVFSNPPESIDEGEFNAFQDKHNLEVLEVPGFRACRRYSLKLNSGSQFPSLFRSVSLYVVDRPAAELREQLTATADRRGHPDWWKDVVLSRCYGESVEGETDPTVEDELYFVFSTPPFGETSEAYFEWYREHSAQNVAASPHLGDHWRYRLTSDVVAEMPEHLALYALHGTAAEMLAETHAAQAAGRVSPTDNFRGFASFEASAIGPQHVA